MGILQVRFQQLLTARFATPLFKQRAPFLLKVRKVLCIKTTIELGVLKFPSQSIEQIKRADQALYRAKKAGRNQTIVAPAEPLAPEMTAA